MVEAVEGGSKDESLRENLRKSSEAGDWELLQFSFHGVGVKAAGATGRWKGTQEKTMRSHCIVLSGEVTWLDFCI